MKSWYCAVLAAAAVFAVSIESAVDADTVTYLKCVVSGASLCSGSNLRGSTGWTYVSVAGYATPGDGGGGEFQALTCMPTIIGDVSDQTTVIRNVKTTAGLWVGEPIVGSGTELQPGSKIMEVSQSADTITLNLVPSSIVNNDMLTVTNSDNGGTVIQDANGTGQCFYRTNYRGDPHEWGAVGASGNSDDTTPLQDWLKWTPGPWIASIPSSYKTNSPLTCWANTAIQGQATLTAGNSATGFVGSPVVRIFAAGSGFTAGTALLTTGDYCRITGIAFDANGASNTMTGQPLDTVDIAGTHNSIDGRSLIENGNYNVYCGGVQVDGLQLKDSEFIKSASHNIYMPMNCANVRLTGDLVQGSGGYGVVFGGDDLTISGGVIEESNGYGLDLETAHFVTACDTYFDDNGGAAIRIAGSSTVTVCGNHVHRSGGDAAGSAHVVFSGANDNVSLSGNVYVAGSTTNDPSMRPFYDYDAETGAGTVLTNTHIYESPRPQMAAVWSPNAVLMGLPSLQVPQIVHNSFAGLTLSNDGTTLTQVDIAPGAAADSTNSAIIQSPGCNVNLASAGQGGLDAGSVAQNTTYFFFVIAGAGGANAAPPACMASANLTPKFKNPYFTGTPYMLTATGWTMAGSTEVYNVSASTGLVPGIGVDSTDTPNPIPNPTTVSALETSNAAATASWSNMSTTVTVSTLSSGMIRQGMIILDTSNQCIPAGTIVSAYASPTITLSNATICASIPITGSTIQLSSGQQVTLSQAATQTGLANLRFSTALYRLAGALYTNPSNTNVIPFTQDGDTFYRTVPAADIGAATLGNSDTTFALASVPNGISVEWLGRCVSSAKVIVYNAAQNPGQPVSFPFAPGFDVAITTGTAEKYQTWTDTAQHIHARANTSGTAFNCMTDGWRFNRAQ